MRSLSKIFAGLFRGKHEPENVSFRDVARKLIPTLMGLADQVSDPAEYRRLLYRALTDFERDTLHKRYYVAAHFLWSDLLGGERCSALLAPLAAMDLEDQSKEALIEYIAVCWRLQGETRDARALLKGTSAKEFSEDYCFELCQIYWVYNEWSLLEAQSRHTAKIKGQAVARRHYCCDFAVLSHYKALQPKIIAGKEQAEDVRALFDCIDWAISILGSDSRNGWTYKGLIACVKGDYANAIECFLVARQRPEWVHTAFRTVEGVVSLEDMQRLGNQPPVRWEKGVCTPHWRHHGHEFAHLLSADQSYFRNFFSRFAKQYGELNPGGLLHLHCVNFEPETGAILKLEKQFNININFTVDMREGLGDNIDLYRGYAACARYIYLPLYLEEYPVVAVTDIDGVPALSSKEIMQACAGKILIKSKLTKSRLHRPVLWSAIWAGTFAASSAPQHLAFASLLSSYLLYRLEICTRTGEKYFFADQVGLFLCYMVCKEICEFDEIPALYKQQGFEDFSVVKNRSTGTVSA
jgi:hypothetical protein